MQNQRTKHFETPDAVRHDLSTLSDDAEALLEATKEIVDEKVKSARVQLNASIKRSQEVYNGLQKKALKGAKYADEVVHEHPYQTAIVALGMGVILGLVCGRRK